MTSVFRQQLVQVVETKKDEKRKIFFSCSKSNNSCNKFKHNNISYKIWHEQNLLNSLNAEINKLFVIWIFKKII